MTETKWMAKDEETLNRLMRAEYALTKPERNRSRVLLARRPKAEGRQP